MSCAAALRSAVEETDHLVRLAEDLLVLARAHGGRLPVRGMPTDLRALLEDIAGRHRPRATKAGVAIDVEAPSGSVCVDQVRLRQALDDLLDNALRYSPRGGASRSPDRWKAAPSRLPSRTWSRILADVLSRAFEPFVGTPTPAGRKRRFWARSRDRPRHRRRPWRVGRGGELARWRRLRHDEIAELA